MNDTEALVATHPRDKLLIMRQNKISLEKEEKIKEWERKRRLRKDRIEFIKKQKEQIKTKIRVIDIQSSEKILYKFAEHYLGEYQVSCFLIRERLELIKLCASYCGRWLAVFASPIIASLIAILYSVLFVSTASFILLPVWICFVIIYLKIILAKQDYKYLINFFDYIQFLWHQQLLIKNENSKLREEKNK